LTSMDEDEAAQREAERKAAALYSVGWEAGAGTTIWAQAVRDALALHGSARNRYAKDTADRESHERLYSSALLLVVAIAQVLAFEWRVRRLANGDDDLVQARARFDAVSPDARMLRDLVAHLDDYAVGEGHRQTGKQEPPLSTENGEIFIYWTDGGGTILRLGDKKLNLRTAAAAATELAQVVERVRARQLERVGQEANAAMQRRYGLPPE
jgi:hypothetical protein